MNDPRVALLFAVYRSKRCPSGRTIRKYLARDGGLTERLDRRWLTENAGEAEDRARALSVGRNVWRVTKVDLVQGDGGLWGSW